jgi:hypothetical protein
MSVALLLAFGLLAGGIVLTSNLKLLGTMMYGLRFLGLSLWLLAGCSVEPPQAVSNGTPAPSFSARTLDGRVVNFPEDFKGRWWRCASGPTGAPTAARRCAASSRSTNA